MSEDDMQEMLTGISTPCELVVVCGNNKKLKEQLDKFIEKGGEKHIVYHTLGFTKEMHEWMAMASLFIGKPGGLSCSECLAMGLPMVIWNPIPGQEMFNTLYLLENGAAIFPNNISTLSFRVDELLKIPSKLAEMSRNAKAISRGDAAKFIVDNAIEHNGEGAIKISRK